MIKISKDEMKWLVSKGVVFGENGISHTYTKHRNYYLCEQRKNLALLYKYRNDRIVR